MGLEIELCLEHLSSILLLVYMQFVLKVHTIKNGQNIYNV